MIRDVRHMMLTTVISMLVSHTAFADGWQAIGPPSGVIHSFAFNAERTSLYATTDSGLMRLNESGGWQYVRRNGCIDWPIGSECISYLKIYRHPMRQDVWFVGWQDVWYEIETFVSRMHRPEGLWEDVRGYARSLTYYNITFHPSNPAVIYGNLESFVRSDDTGKTWSYPAGQSAFRRAGFIASDIRRQATIYTIGSPNSSSYYGIYKTTDNGSNWSLAYRDSFGYELTYSAALAAGDTVLIGMNSSPSFPETGILYSADGGASWRKVLKGISVTALARDKTRPNYVFAGTSEGLYISGNGGISWERWNTTLPRYPIVQIEPDPDSDTVYVATTGGGMFRVYGFSTAISMELQEPPGAYALFPVYPNPFNSTARVEISLPRAEDVFIEAMNMLGQRIAVLAEGYVTGGKHSYAFNGDSLPSGMYYIRARLGGRQFVGSVVLLR